MNNKLSLLVGIFIGAIITGVTISINTPPILPTPTPVNVQGTVNAMLAALPTETQIPTETVIPSDTPRPTSTSTPTLSISPTNTKWPATYWAPIATDEPPQGGGSTAPSTLVPSLTPTDTDP